MKIEAQIANDWPEGSPVVGVCVRLWRNLQAVALSDHYSYHELQEMASAPADKELIQALLYLSNPTLALLKPTLLYEDSQGYIFELPSDEVDRYMTGEAVINPSTGTTIDPADLLVSFVPGERLISRNWDVGQ